MDLNNLHSDEFEVECLVRDLKGNPVNKFVILKVALINEEENPVLKPYKAHSAARSAPQRELQRCALKIKEHREWITNIKAEEDKLEPKLLHTVESRLLHISGRLNRLLFTTKTYKQQCRDQLRLVDLVLTAVQALIQGDNNLNETIEKIKASQQEDPEELSTSEDEEQTQKRAVHQTTETTTGSSTNADKEESELTKILSSTSLMAHQHPTHSLRSIDKWKIFFDGDSRELSIERFLFRVEHQAKTYNISNEELVQQFGILLKGAALNWYWCHIERHPTISWNTLKSDIIERFQDRRTDHDIRRNIESRKQKSNESFRTFYNDIIALSLQFRNPLPDSELLHIVRRNMRTGFQNTLADQDIPSIAILVRRCLALEDTWKRTGYEPEKLCARRNIEEFDLADTEDIVEHVDEINTRATKNYTTIQTKPSTSQISNESMAICWNCQDIGHIFIDCPKPAQIFCFGCGRPGIVKPNCFRCSGNLSMRVRTSGNPTPSLLPKTSTTRNSGSEIPHPRQ